MSEIKGWQGSGEIRTHTLLGEVWNGMAPLENSLVFPQMMKGRITTGPSNSTPNIYSREIKTYDHTRAFT